jgi:hypothetical protein
MAGKIQWLWADGAALFSLDAATIQARLARRLSRLEFGALVLNLIWIPVVLWLNQNRPVVLSDYKIYLAASEGNFEGFYYGIWFLAPFNC